MFGKPEWFREKSRGWGLRPVKFQGWLYSAAWMGALGLPFAGLILRHQVPEALIWLLVSSGMLAWDVRGIRQALRRKVTNDVLYIGDEVESVHPRMAAAGHPAR